MGHKHRLSTCWLILLVGGCAGACNRPPASAPETPTAAEAATQPRASNSPSGSGAQLELVPVAQYPSGEAATATRLRALLGAEGIEAVEYGSAGVTVAVSPCDADRARRIVAGAEAEGLNVSIVPSDTASDPADVPEHLKRWPGLYVRRDGTIVDAPEPDQALARTYPSQPCKGPLHDGMRLTLMTHRRVYRVDEEVRVLHVLEATGEGHPVYVMGPKVPHGEYVDDRLATSPPPTDEYPWLGVYDGVVLDSPAVDYNYDITTYRFSTPGRHRIQWRLGQLESNVLELSVEAQ